MQTRRLRKLENQSGQTMTEYAVILAFIFLVVVVVIPGVRERDQRSVHQRHERVRRLTFMRLATASARTTRPGDGRVRARPADPDGVAARDHPVRDRLQQLHHAHRCDSRRRTQRPRSAASSATAVPPRRRRSRIGQGLDQSKLDPDDLRTASPDWNTPGNDVTVTASYPYSINILGWTVKAGNLTSTTKERLE